MPKKKEGRKAISVTLVFRLEIDLTSSTQTVANVMSYIASLVSRPLPDFIFQLWRFGRRPVTITISHTGNDGLD